MRKFLCIIFVLFIFLSGCANTDSHDILGENAPKLSLTIVDGAESGNLILAGEKEWDVYSVHVEEIPVFLDGKKADKSVLEDGMPIDIYYNGGIMETFPAQIGGITGIAAYSRGSKQNPYGALYDLSGMYLKVLNDLWETDTGLNGETKFVSVYLDEAPGDLTDGEKSAIMWIFSNSLGKTGMALSFNELVEEGYIREGELYWEDGLLFTITESPETGVYHGLRVIEFNAQKWRSGLGANFFVDCKGVWSQTGSWDYKIGGFAIS